MSEALEKQVEKLDKKIEGITETLDGIKDELHSVAEAIGNSSVHAEYMRRDVDEAFKEIREMRTDISVLKESQDKNSWVPKLAAALLAGVLGAGGGYTLSSTDVKEATRQKDIRIESEPYRR